MAFIILKRSRNTHDYYLVENYRDEAGRHRRRALCYLGRRQDETDTLEKALAYWQKVREQVKREIPAAKGERKQVLRRRLHAIEARIGVIWEHVAVIWNRATELAAVAEAERRKCEQEAEEAAYWQAIERLRHSPLPDNAHAAKRAYLWLAKRHHPDQGGSHQAFLRVKDAYDQAQAVWRHRTE